VFRVDAAGREQQIMLLDALVMKGATS